MDSQRKLHEDSSNTTDKQHYFNAEKIEDTPFTLITNEKECFGVVGRNRVTKLYKPEEREKVREELMTPTWHLITSVIWVMLENQKELKELTEKI